MTRIWTSFLFAAGLALSPGLVLAVESDITANLKLTGFGGGDAQLQAVKNAIARFNIDYPNVTVEVTLDPISNGWGDFVTRVISQFNANNASDVYGTAIETMRTFETRGLFMPLDDYIAKNPGFADFNPALFEYGSYEGKTYFVPYVWDTIMVNYNRKLFNDAGVDYPKADWTWDEFREVAKKLTVSDAAGNITQFGYEVPNQNFFVQPWFFSNGTSHLNADWTGSNMLDPKVTETLQFLYDLIHVDKVSPIPGKDGLDNQFMAGQVAMIGRGHWLVQNAKAADLDMDVAVQPQGSTQGTVIGFGGYAVSKTTQHPDLAMALISALTALESQEDEGEFGGGIPGNRKAAETEGFLAFPPSAELYYGVLPITRPVPSPANFQEVESIFVRYYRAMMAGEISIAEGVQLCHEELEASFARLRAQTTS